MSKLFDRLEPEHVDFVAGQQIFFVATAAPDGRVNLSPKGMDSLRVPASDRILWLNLTGSGNETAAHLAESPRMTLMWCSFGTRPLILRAYGTARAIHPRDPDWARLSAELPPEPGARQVIEMQVDLVQTSCGFAVPLMDFRAERTVLRGWARQKGEAGLAAYWAERNGQSLDGRPTGIAE
ncbi:MAG: pyridoxamine 5'-phosphate oxidase family protein [Gemmobacter sp.]